MTAYAAESTAHLPEERLVDELLRRIGALVSRRQELRAARADAVELERNRLEIVSCQRELNRTFIALHASASPI